MTAIDRLLARLPDAKRSGKGWQARCPAHDDESPSLSVAIGDGCVLVKCHRGCELSAIVSALGLTMRDLFDDKPPTSTPKLGPIVCTYDYQRLDGSLAFQTVRYAEPAKTFRQRRPDGNGGWIWNLDGIEPMLYRLPQLRGQPEVIVAEGEKDCDRLAALGFVATTNPMGAGKWRDSHTQQLVAAGVQTVHIPPDNDEPGAKHALSVAASCHAAGLTVKVVTLPGLPPKGDVSDWLAQGHTGNDLLDLLTAAPVWQRSAQEVAEQPNLTARRVWTLAEAARIDFPADLWLIKNLLPGDGTALDHGDVRVGKSLLWIAKGLAVAAGVPAFGASSLPVCETGAVAYVTEEDPLRRIVERSRMIAAGYGLASLPSNFYIISPSGLSLDNEDDQSWLTQALIGRKVRLVILDPIRSLTSCTDAGPRELKPFVTYLRALARATGAVVGLGHHDAKPAAGVQDTRRRGHKASGGGIYSIADFPVHVERQGAVVVLTPHSFKFASDPPRLHVRPTFEAAAIRFVVTMLADQAADEAGELIELVLTYVTDHPGQSTNKIRKALGRRQADVATALHELETRQQVTLMLRGKAHTWSGVPDSIRRVHSSLL